MTVSTMRAGALLAALAVAAGCESKKSSNPLSPSVAGPIPGVEISAPKPLEPGQGWEVSADKQPINLLIENPGSNGQRPLQLEVEVAADEGFSTKVFEKGGIAVGPDGRTSVPLPSKLTGDRTYFWRAKAQDGANHGPWSSTVRFSVLTPAVLQAPTPKAPVGGVTVGDLTPSFRVGNAPRSGAIGNITYIVEVSRNDSFTQVVASATGGETGGSNGESTIGTAGDLPGSATLFWRARAWDGKINGPWSSTQSFKTPAAPSSGGGGGGGGGGGSGGGGTGGGGGSCAASTGQAIVACISAKYPQYRRGGVSHNQRIANMEFLRDRIIEAGLCGGMDLGWNLKRGGPDISHDFIAERKNGRVHGYDFAAGSKVLDQEVELYWGEGHSPFYKKYTRSFSCN
jgi:hypothetical protein